MNFFFEVSARSTQCLEMSPSILSLLTSTTLHLSDICSFLIPPLPLPSPATHIKKKLGMYPRRFICTDSCGATLERLQIFRPLLFLMTSFFFQLFPLIEPLNRLAMTIEKHSGSSAPFGRKQLNLENDATTSILSVGPLKSPLAPILGLLVIPVYCRQTSFSNASINFYEKPMEET